MRFHVPKCRALELIYLYALVLIICLSLSRFGKPSEFSKFSEHFEVKKVNSVSEGSNWLGYYSTPVIGKFFVNPNIEHGGGLKVFWRVTMINYNEPPVFQC